MPVMGVGPTLLVTLTWCLWVGVWELPIWKELITGSPPLGIAPHPTPTYVRERIDPEGFMPLASESRLFIYCSEGHLRFNGTRDQEAYPAKGLSFPVASSPRSFPFQGSQSPQDTAANDLP